MHPAFDNYQCGGGFLSSFSFPGAGFQYLKKLYVYITRKIKKTATIKPRNLPRQMEALLSSEIFSAECPEKENTRILPSPLG